MNGTFTFIEFQNGSLAVIGNCSINFNTYAITSFRPRVWSDKFIVFLERKKTSSPVFQHLHSHLGTIFRICIV